MATIDTSIYSQLLRPPKSVAEYDAEALQLQQNRLAPALNQTQLDDRTRGIEESNRLRQVVSGFGKDAVANKSALLSAGLMKPALEYGKASDESAKTAAETARLGAQSQKEKLDMIFQANGLVGSAAGATMQNPDYNNAVGVVSGLKAKLGPELSQQLGLDALEIPRDPAQLKAWANDHYLGSIDTAKQLDDARVKSEGLANRNNQVSMNNADNATSRANNASSNAVQMRGQNMTDARAKRATNAGRMPAGYRANADGTLTFIPGGPADPAIKANAKPPTEFQGKSAIFGARAEEADKIIASLNGKYSPSAINSKNAVERTWGIGGILGAATNKMALTPEDQRAEQAQRDLINAVLRQESGAAIADSEFDNARRQYFPQPGDSPEVIAQKSRNRKLSVQGLRGNAGNAAFSAPEQEPVSKAAPPSKIPQGWTVTKVN